MVDCPIVDVDAETTVEEACEVGDPRIVDSVHRSQKHI